MRKALLLFLLFPFFINAQENALDIFRPLENYIWNAEGKWGDGSLFKQEITLEYSLEDNIIIVKSLGFIDKEQTKFGLRNHGTRIYDKKTKIIKFWEFDIFGSVTEGTVRGDGKNIIYQYQYGDTSVTEMWVYINEHTYDFIVGVYDGKKWQQKFLETQFNGSNKR